MPLSKERMRERKKKDRAKNRFDALNSPAQDTKDVKPKMYMAGVEIGIPEIDADGNIVPEYW